MVNKQNKEHFALFHFSDPLLRVQDNISWIEMLLDKHQYLLNNRVARISPRRGIKQAIEAAKPLIDDDMVRYEIDELVEYFETE